MPFSIFGPPTTDWTAESRRRLGTTSAGYENAIRNTRRDALGLARSTSGVGSGAAASRAAMQALTPAIADMRTSQAAAMEETRARLDEERRLERERQADFANNLFGGLSGVAGQMLVPLIGGLGGGGAPASTPGGMSAPARPMASTPTPVATAVTPAATGPFSTASGAPEPAAMPVEETEEERRRREAAGFGSVLRGAAPFAGMANPFAGLALNAAGGFFR